MQQLLITGEQDPIKTPNNIFYISNTRFMPRSNNWQLAGKATTCDYDYGTAAGRSCLLMNNSSANSVKLTYSLRPANRPYASIGLSQAIFTWTIALWVYVGPEDFSANITTSNINTAGQYLGAFNFIKKSAQDSGESYNKQQMRLYIGRGSATTLSLVLARYQNTGSWVAIKTNKAGNTTLSKGWHLVWIKPQSTRSTLVWGIDKLPFTNITSYFNVGVDWTTDFNLGTDFCVSCSNKTNSSVLPRGPFRIFNNILTTTDLSDLHDNDIW